MLSNPEEKQKTSFERGKQNSLISEEYVKNKYGIKVDEYEPLDSMKRRVEVKSCQLILKDRFDSSFRKGIFILRKHQHDFILKSNGNYIFVLMYQSKVVADIRCKASEVQHLIEWDSTEHCKIPWSEVIPYTSAFEFLKQAPPAELIATGSFAQKMLRG